MKERTLYPLWATGYVLCLCLGAIPERSALGQWVLTAVGVLFFVPGAALLYLALKKKDRAGLRRLRLISGLSLALTTVLITANLLSVLSGSMAMGDVLYILLLLVSSPMSCCGWWVMSLFLWAFLFLGSFPQLWGKKS